MTFSIRLAFCEAPMLRASAKKFSRLIGVISSYKGPFSGKYPMRLAISSRLSATSKPQILAVPVEGAK